VKESRYNETEILYDKSKMKVGNDDRLTWVIRKVEGEEITRKEVKHR
jgi:hypothetical protein